jgi:DNA-binding YbaB/EbfC family protein
MSNWPGGLLITGIREADLTFRRLSGSVPGMAGLGKMMKQMAKLQKKMTALQEDLGQQEMTVSSGGGAVSVTISLQSEIKAIKLDPEFLKEDVAMVEETLLEAVSDALKQAGEKSESAMAALTSEFQVPGMPGM